MSALIYLNQWKRAGTIGEAQHDILAALVRRDRFSLFVELNALLYLGVLSLAAGAGWTIATYSARLGDVAILATLTAVFGASLYYCFTHAPPYSQEQVEPPGLAFDYVLYLGCLIFVVELGYVESRFHPFGTDWDQSLSPNRMARKRLRPARPATNLSAISPLFYFSDRGRFVIARARPGACCRGKKLAE